MCLLLYNIENFCDYRPLGKRSMAAGAATARNGALFNKNRHQTINDAYVIGLDANLCCLLLL
jgi:hypothetical protein